MSLTVAESVSRIARRMAARWGQEARDESRELIAAVLQQSRSWPQHSAETVLDDEQLSRIEAAADRRLQGAPLAYAARSAPFRALSLYVDERVLIPRPETEFLVDCLAATGALARGGVAVDVGTGSGAIALALASEGSFARVIATDISDDALAVARENTDRCGQLLRVRLELRSGDALAPLSDLLHSVDLLVSNPPYIAFDEVPALPADVRDWEPPQALACPDDGLSVTRAIAQGGGDVLRAGGLLAFETDSRRAQRVAELVGDVGAYEDIRVLHDLTGRERYVFATRR